MISKSILLLMMIFSICCNTVKATRITDNFKYCEVYDNRVILDITDTCKQSTLIQDDKKISLHILNQRTNMISGIGHQCKKQKIKITTYKSFLRYETNTREITNVDLTKEDCFDMLITKRCEHQIMQCENDNCFYNKDPEIAYQWMVPLEFTSYICEISTRPIDGEKEDSILFPK